MNKKLDQIIDEIWCAGYNKGSNNIDDDNTEFIKDMRIEILKCFNQPIDRQSDETRLTSELDDILLNIKYSTIDGLVNLNHYDIRLAKKQIIAWHETEKQNLLKQVWNLSQPDIVPEGWKLDTKLGKFLKENIE